MPVPAHMCLPPNQVAPQVGQTFIERSSNQRGGTPIPTAGPEAWGEPGER